MGNISSINFEPSKQNNCEHNDRTLKPSYLCGTDFKCSCSAEEAREKYNEMLLSAVEKYTKRTHQAPQFREENLRWSAVCNITSEHTLEDLKKLAEHFKEKYGFQCYQYAIHRDEGEKLFLDKEKTKPKLDKAGNQVYRVNYHAHLEFLMLNENGCTCFKKKDFGKKKMSEIQTEVAQILGMKRGKFFSDSVRLDHNQYRQEQRRIEKAQEIARAETRKEYTDEIVNVILAKEKLQEDLKENYISKKDVKAEIEKARKEWVQESGHTADDYKKLRALNQQQYKDIEELQEKIRNLEAELKAEKEKKQPDRPADPPADLQTENQTGLQELKTAYPSVEECLKNPQVNKMAKTLMDVAEELEVPKNKKGHVELPKIVDAAKEVKKENKDLKAENKEVKAENIKLKNLITKATQAINHKLKTAYTSFKDAVNHLLSWPHPEQNPGQNPEPQEHQEMSAIERLASFRQSVNDLYRSKSENNDRQNDRQKPGQSERPEKPKKSRDFER